MHQLLLPPLSIPGLGSLPPVEVRTILIGVHLLGFGFGLGGATMLDFWVLRWMRFGHLPADVVRTFEFISKVVTVGLLLLWISGLSFLLLYTSVSPEKLANPKIVAKLVIVFVLTANGFIVHRLLLPQIAASASLPLLREETFGRRLLFVVSGAISGVSWYSAFALGLLHEFNGRVPATTILTIWLMCILAVSVTTAVLLVATDWRRSHPGSLDAHPT